MGKNDPAVVAISDAEVWELLRITQMGRLATHAADELDIFPINYVVDGSTLVFRTAPGTKLLELTVNHSVAFEIDGGSEHMVWAVIVKGTAEELHRQADIDHAEQLALVTWVTTPKDRYVRITPTSVTGRRFIRGPEPEVSHEY
jgi:nitroimidazol reductase NimA-like FMN-containing flavoprotein (pyridoxamine 5'-phosphate oxidase superfamily)